MTVTEHALGFTVMRFSGCEECPCYQPVSNTNHFCGIMRSQYQGRIGVWFEGDGGAGSPKSMHTQLRMPGCPLERPHVLALLK